MIVPEKSAPRAKLPTTLPLLPVRDIVVFPYMVLPLAVGREKSTKALEESMGGARLIFLAAQKRVQTEDPGPEDVFPVGTVTEILQLLKMPDGTVKILVEGIARAHLKAFRLIAEKGYVEVDLESADERCEATPEIQALMRQGVALFETYVKLNRRVPYEIAMSISNIEEPDRLADTIASHVLIKMSDKQQLLEITHPGDRLEKIIELLNSEIEILNIERRIQNRVRGQIEKTQKEYYLTEQMKAIQKELKQKDDFAKELDELREKIKAAQMSKDATETAHKEIDRLEKMMPFSPEATVIRTYLDWLIHLPWSVLTQDNLDIARAETILNEDHYSLEKAKERILEYLAVLKLVKKIKGPILCFVGPPGVGKTSLAKSIARALERNFVRMSLGGARDEAEIRGHRRTYIGALPGRILQSMRKAKFKNPVFLLDEIDKMGTDWRGDPAAALLEVLDPEQNHSFVDHYLDLEFDLSHVLFICTANTLYSIPASLQDRLEIIRFSGYTEDEKIQIARQYLIPKQLREHGLSEGSLNPTREALQAMLREYTREAGVRNLERKLAALCRKVAKIVVRDGNHKTVQVTPQNLGEFLGVPEFSKEKIAPNTRGVATGLAWTEQGGETLAIEVAVMKGKGNLTLTGKLGEVMQESAQAALTYVRSAAQSLRIREGLFAKSDFHLHVPEGAIPKDGPSAGIAMATALASALMGRPVKKDLAMTGEVTLQGRVLPIGGLKEKALAAYRDGIQTILFPEGNRKDLTELPEEVKKKIKLVPVKHMDEVLQTALENRASKASLRGGRLGRPTKQSSRVKD